MRTSEGKCVLVEVGALISWCIYSYRIVMLLVPYMWASMTFLPKLAILLSNVTTSARRLMSYLSISVVTFCEKASEHTVSRI